MLFVVLISAVQAGASVWTFSCGGDPWEQKSVFDKSEFVCAAGMGLNNPDMMACGLTPCADLFVMPNRIWAGGETLTDYMGSENRVWAEMMGGAFGFASDVIIATPSKTYVGNFDLVVDNNRNGKFDAGDDVNALNDSFAFSIVDLGHPPVDAGPIKDAAKAMSQGASDAIAKWKAGCDLLDAMGSALSLMSGDVIGAAIGVIGNLTGIATDYNGAVIAKATDLIGGFDPNSTPQKASGIYGNIAKHWYDLYEDPPDPNFTQFVSLDFAAINAELAAASVADSYPFSVKGTDPREAALIRIANRAVEQGALVKALRQSYEKYQGAAAASNYEYAYRQLEQTRVYTQWLLANLSGFKGDLDYLKSVLTAQGVAGTVIKVSEMQALKDRVASQGLTADEISSLKGVGFSDERIVLLTQYIKSISVPAADFTMAASIDELAAKVDLAVPGIQSFDSGLIAALNNLAPEFTPHHPVAAAGGPYAGSTGNQVSFDGGGSSDPDVGDTLSFAWDFDGDGQFDDGAGQTVLYTWTKPFSGLIGLKVADAAGHSSIGYAKVAISDANLAPVIDSFTPADKAPMASVKNPLTLQVVAHDPEGGALTYQWSVDGLPAGSGASYTLTPAAGFKGTKRVMVSVRDAEPANAPAVEARIVNVYLDCDPDDPATMTGYYRDADGDGYGDPLLLTLACSAPAGYVTNKLDCDDSSASVGVATLRFYRDQDGDGLGSASSLIACTAPAGYVANTLDCDDANLLVGQATQGFYRDQDGDGLGNPVLSQVACSAPAGYVVNSADCNDGDPGVGDTLTTYYRDVDGDGFGTPSDSVQACLQPAGYVTGGVDCDDANPFVNPTRKEKVHNGRDDDCSPATLDNWSKSFVLGIDDSSWIYYAKSNGDGTFSNYRRTDINLDGGTSRGIVIEDFNGDGYLDFMAGRGNGSYYLFTNDGSDNFAYRGIPAVHQTNSGYAMDMAVGDFNNDSLVDFVGNANNTLCNVFLNDGKGGFARSSITLPNTGRGLDSADFDGDGDLDFVSSFYGANDVWLYKNDGKGIFAGIKAGTANGLAADNYALTAADFDNDGNSDLIVSGSSNGDAAFLKGNGDGTFRTSVAVPSLDSGRHGSMDAYDLNQDGKADIVFSDYTGYRIWFYPGNGDGTFAARTEISTSGTSNVILAVAAPPAPNPAPFPVADAQPAQQTAAVGAQVPLTGSFSKDPAAIASYSWNFGDLSSASGADQLHAYASEGVFFPSLTVVDGEGRRDVDVARVTVNANPPSANPGGPYAIGEAAAVGARYTALFDGAGSGDDFGIATYEWTVGDSFLDDFADGNATGWAASAGTWTVTGERYEQTNASPDRADTLTGNAQIGDYTVETDLMILSGSGQEAILLFRGLDANNHYEFIFRGRGLDDLLLYKQVSGSHSQLAQAYLPFPLQLNTWYKLKVEAYQKSIKCYVNDVLYIDYTETSDPSVTTFKYGKIGLSTYRSAARFDNVKQYALRTGATPQFVIPEGTFPVTLKVTDKAGQSASAATQVTAAKGNPPVAVPGGPYTFDEAYASQNKWTVTLDGSLSSDDTAVETYFWNFGDGTTGTGAKPSHVYTGAGTYNVTLTVTDHAGLSHSASTTVTTKGNGIPTANPGLPYAVDERAAVAGKWTVNFDGRGSTDDRSIYDYQWRFGDGGTGTGPTPTYQYSNPGVYTVTLTVRDHAFQSHTATTTATVSVNAAPVARPGGPYSVDESAAKDGKWTVNLDGSLSSDDYGLWKYEWNFGDASTGTGAKPTHVYAAPGTYTATLTVTDNGKQASSATVLVQVAGSQPPVASAGPDRVTEVGYPATLDSSASTDDFGIYTYQWQMGVPSWSYTPFERSGGQAVISGDYSDWNRYIVSDIAFPRIAGESYTGRVMLTATNNGNRQLMWGLKNSGTTYGYQQFVYAIYFNNGSVQIYENGSNRGSFGSFVNNTSYDVRIDLKAVGATYWYRQTGAADWTKLYESANASTTPLRPGATLLSGLWQLSGFTAAGEALMLPPTAVANQVTATGIYDVPGSYTATVTVTDHAQLSSSDTATVTVVAGEPPVAETGGPYLTNEDIPTRFNARASRDDFGIKWYRWDFGDGEGITTRNPWVDHRYTREGVYAVTLTVTDYAGHTASASTTATVSPEPVVAGVPWQFSGAAEMPHDTWSGKEITLKGVAWSLRTPLTYRWDFGDGSAPVTGAVTDKKAIQAKHTYTGVDGQPFTATLTVTDAEGRSATDQYPVRVRAKSLDVEINVSIDEGLWWLHTNQNRSFFAKGTYGNAVVDAGYWDNAGGWNGDAGGGVSGLYTSSPTASALHAFQTNGHLELGDVRKNPYVETVARGMRFTASRMSPYPIGRQTYGDPDTNGNGLGVQTVEYRSIYELGQVMDCLVASGNRTSYAITGPAGVIDKSYEDLVTDMVDMYSWGQTDDTGRGGGWRYSWNSDIDNSAAQWGAIGMLAAEEVWKIKAPKWVKERNNVWLNNSYDGTGFGYGGPGNGVNTTPSGMVQLAFDDMVGYDDPATAADERDPRWVTAERYIATRWNSSWWYPNSSLNYRFTYYGYYAFAKSMRSAKPKPVVNLKETGLDWYKDNVNGMARRLVNRQQANGSWPMDQEPGSYVGYDLTTAWSVIILTPTLFVQPPVADAGEDRVWGVDVELTLDGSRSFHLDPFRKIVQYEWDLDGDGVFDTSGTDPKTTYTYTRALYPENTLPRVVNVTLRVTDDNDPPKSSTDTAKITIAVPPHPPVADAGGPYTCYVGIPCPMDGGGSFDIDPSDVITAWEWDVNGDRVYTDLVGATPAALFATPGAKNIGLRVTDNGVMSPNGRLEAFAFTTANVLPNNPPVAVPGGPYTVGEGVSLMLDATGSSDPDGNAISYAWDLDQNGSFETTGANPLFTRGDNGIFTVTLKVSDGALEATATTTVTVANAAPVVNPPAAATISEGGTFVAGGSFTDPGDDTWTATVDYGDGTGLMPLALTGKGFLLNHVYPQDGVYTVTVTVTDDDGGQGTGSTQVTVNNVAPAVNAGPDASITSSDTFVSAGSFADPGADAWTATVDYGDGSGVQPLSLNPDQTFSLSHVYAASGSYTVTVTVRDSFGASGSDQALVQVVNNLPVVNAGPDGTILEGSSFVSGGSFSDQGSASWSATVDYGDGSGLHPLPLKPDKSFDLSHLYQKDGSYTVTVHVTDSEGGSATDSAVVTVGNVAPVVYAGPDAAIQAGGTFASNGYFTDPGADIFSATVDYGDGSGLQPLTLNPDKSFDLNHVYLLAGNYTVTVNVSDGLVTGSDSAHVTASVASCLTTLTARAKSATVQLNWSASEHTAATRYDIYRSTEGPSSGFVKIRSGYTSTYPVFVDSGLVNGRIYYYRIEKSLGTGAGFCSSKVVQAKPVALF